MKKLTTLLVMLLFTAGMAIGQNNLTLDQINGNANDAEVLQNGGNDAVILQDGTLNVTDFIQRHFNTDRHQALIRQIGYRNEADVLSQGGVGANDVDLLQLGNSNEAIIAQYQGSNTAYVDSRGNSNFAEVAHRGTFDSYADIEQIGDGNDATITMMVFQLVLITQIPLLLSIKMVITSVRFLNLSNTTKSSPKRASSRTPPTGSCTDREHSLHMFGEIVYTFS